MALGVYVVPADIVLAVTKTHALKIHMKGHEETSVEVSERNISLQSRRQDIDNSSAPHVKKVGAQEDDISGVLPEASPTERDLAAQNIIDIMRLPTMESAWQFMWWASGEEQIAPPQGSLLDRAIKLLLKDTYRIPDGVHLEVVYESTALRTALNMTGSKDDHYPNNYLRNRARAAATSSHFFIVDADHWPMESLCGDLNAALNAAKRAASSAIVIPSMQTDEKEYYFTDKGIKKTKALCAPLHTAKDWGFLRREDPQGWDEFVKQVPRTVDESSACMRNGSYSLDGTHQCGACRQYRNPCCPSAVIERSLPARLVGNVVPSRHMALGHRKSLLEGDGRMHPRPADVADLVPPFLKLPCITATGNQKKGHFMWEPYIVVPNGDRVPYADERFYGYGKNKISWIMAIRTAGLDFYTFLKAGLFHMPHASSSLRKDWEANHEAFVGGSCLAKSGHCSPKNGTHAEKMDQLFRDFTRDLYEDNGPPVLELCTGDETDISRLRHRCHSLCRDFAISEEFPFGNCRCDEEDRPEQQEYEIRTEGALTRRGWVMPFSFG